MLKLERSQPLHSGKYVVEKDSFLFLVSLTRHNLNKNDWHLDLQKIMINIGTRSLTEILSMSHNNFVCEGGSRAGQKKKGQKLF